MSSVIECNGIRAYNNLKLSVTASNVIEVTSYNSVMVPSTPGSSGGGRGSKHLDSSLVLALIEKIEMFGQNSTVVGCVAWLSHPLILEALKKCRRVLIVVNREDYTVWGNGKCLQYYKQLPDFDQPISVAFEHLNTILNTLEPGRKAGKSSFASIRAYGATNSLEHNKWLIFFESRFVTFRMLCDDSHSIQRFVDRYGLCLALKKRLQKDNLDLNDGAWFEFPCAYWTGSMNFTKRSESHHESAEFIVNDDLAFNKFLDFSATFMNSTSVASTSRSATPANKGKMNVI